MAPLEPLYVSLPWALCVLALGWRPWRREAPDTSGPISSALAIAGGWCGAWAAALGLPALPPADASQRLFCAIVLSLLLAPLEARRRGVWVAVGWLALVTVFAQRTLPAFARGRHWEDARSCGSRGLRARARSQALGRLVILAAHRLVPASLVRAARRGHAQGLVGASVGATGFAARRWAPTTRALPCAPPGFARLAELASRRWLTSAGSPASFVVPVPPYPRRTRAGSALAAHPWDAAVPRGWFSRVLAVLAGADRAVDRSPATGYRAQHDSLSSPRRGPLLGPPSVPQDPPLRPTRS
jgi:hypothetical protein